MPDLARLRFLVRAGYFALLIPDVGFIAAVQGPRAASFIEINQNI